MLKLLRVTGEREGVCSASLRTIGGNIKRLRIAAGWKLQGEFADAVGVKQASLSDWERGRYALPDTGSLLRIAKVLGCSIDRLLEGVDRGYESVRSRSDLIRHGETATIGDVPAPSEVATRRLEQKEYQQLVAETEEIATRLLDIAGELANAELQDRSAARGEPRSRRGNRKTG